MIELIVAILGGSGLLAIIGIIIRQVLKSMGGHVGRMGKHVDRLDEAFNTQTKAIVSSIDGVRDEVKSVRSALQEHVDTEDETHGSIIQRLDSGEVFNNLLLERVGDIETEIKRHHPNGCACDGGNGVSERKKGEPCQQPKSQSQQPVAQHLSSSLPTKVENSS